MKNKRQLYLLGGIIVICLLYFFIPDPTDPAKRDIIELAAVNEAAVKQIVIVHEGAEVVLEKTGGRWQLSKKIDTTSGGAENSTYDVDEVKFEKILEWATKPWQLELVSTAQAYHKYGLDAEKRTELRVRDEDDKVLRAVYIGETGHRFNTRYVLVEDQPEVLQSLDKIGFTFAVKPNDIRQREMITVGATNLKSLRITTPSKKGKQITLLTKQNAPAKPTENSASADDDSSEDKAATKSPPATADSAILDWVDEKGAVYKKSEVDDMVNTLVALRASGFEDERLLADHKDKALLTYDLITSASGVSEVTIYLLERDKDNGYLMGVSTQSTLFRIPSIDGERLDVKVAELKS